MMASAPSLPPKVSEIGTLREVFPSEDKKNSVSALRIRGTQNYVRDEAKVHTRFRANNSRSKLSCAREQDLFRAALSRAAAWRLNRLALSAFITPA